MRWKCEQHSINSWCLDLKYSPHTNTHEHTLTKMVLAGNVGGEWPSTRSLALQVIKGQWFMIFSTSFIMSAAGATYMFGLYSHQIKSSLGYDQTTLNLLSFFKDVGTNVGILSGLMNEVTPPWFVLYVGGVLNFFGYLMVWLAVSRKISTPQVWQMCLYIYIGANSQSFSNTGALVTAVQNFPESRGAVLGLLKGFLGLSGAIITQIYFAVYGDDLKSLILLIGILPSVICFVFGPSIRVMKIVRVPHELKVMYKFLYVSLGLAGFLMLVIILQKQLNFARGEFGFSAAVVIVLLFLPIGIVVKEELFVWRMKRQGLEDGSGSQLKIVTEKPSAADAGNTREGKSEKNETGSEISCWNAKSIFRPPKVGDDYTILQALFSIDMLILVFAVICGIGGTLTAIDNLGQIGSSLGYPKKSISTFVSLVSIWNYLGRVVGGFLSEHVLKMYKFPRSLMLTIVLFVSCVGHLLIAFDIPNGLYIASVIIGFCFGAQWPLLLAIISELFGLKYYSTLYNFGTMASPIGLYFLNVRLTGNLYDREAERQLRALGQVRRHGEELNCKGPDCFKLAFIIISAVTALGAIVSLLLVIRTKKFYKSDIYKKFRQQEEKAVEEETAARSRNGSTAEVPK